MLANLRFRRCGLPLYDQLDAPLRLKVRMLKAEAMETMLYGCVTWNPTVAHLDIPRKTRRRLLLRCIGWNREHSDGYHILSDADVLAKTGCENVETTVRKRKIFFAGFVARVSNKRVPNRVKYGNWRGKGLRGRARPGLDGLSRTRANDV